MSTWRPADRSLARQVMVLQALLVCLMVLAGLVLAVVDARNRARGNAGDQAVAVALSVADSPAVLAGLRSSSPTAQLQTYAEQVRRDTAVDFVVVMDLAGTRYTHPDPTRIGGTFQGGLGQAPAGTVYTEEYTGTLGPSMRAVVPVRDPAGSGPVVALVAVGITIAAIDHEIVRAVVTIGLAGLALLGVGAVGSWLIARRLGRQTHGLSARELTRMYEYHQAVLHAVQEGLVLLDADHRVQLVNDEARRLLDLPADAHGRLVGELGLPPALVEAAVGGRTETDDVYVVGGHALVVSSAPAVRAGRTVGAVVTVRDRTELQAVSGELDVVRQLTHALRAQNHEAANRLHTVVSLVEMGRPQDAVDFATEELQIAQMLTDSVVASVGDPALSALLLGKSAEAAERGVTLEVHGDVRDDRLAVDQRALVTITGNLIDNALDALGADLESDRPDGHIVVEVTWDSGRFVVAVGDNGPGIPAADAERVLQRGWSTKAGPPGGRGIGLALVAQEARRHGGDVRVGASPLGGASLTVTLRAAAGAGQPAGAGGADAPSGRERP